MPAPSAPVFFEPLWDALVRASEPAAVALARQERGRSASPPLSFSPRDGAGFWSGTRKTHLAMIAAEEAKAAFVDTAWAALSGSFKATPSSDAPEPSRSRKPLFAPGGPHPVPLPQCVESWPALAALLDPDTLPRERSQPESPLAAFCSGHTLWWAERREERPAAIAWFSAPLAPRAPSDEKKASTRRTTAEAWRNASDFYARINPVFVAWASADPAGLEALRVADAALAAQAEALALLSAAGMENAESLSKAEARSPGKRRAPRSL